MKSSHDWIKESGLHNCHELIRKIQADALRHVVPFLESQAEHLVKPANPDDICAESSEMRFGKALGMTLAVSLLLKEATKLDGVKRELFDLKMP